MPTIEHLEPPVNDRAAAKQSAPADRSAAPPLLRLSDLLTDFDADAEARHKARQDGTPFGPETGIKSLDKALGLALSPGLHIVHGVPGVGKTAFALQIAASCGCPCLYVTAEMSPLELLRRITARVTGEYLGRLKTGELSPEYAKRKVREAIEAAPLLALVDATTSPVPTDHLLRLANGTRCLDLENPHLLIVVDSLHSWAEGLAGGAAEYDALNAGLAELRLLAARLKCAVLAVSERNRESMKGGGLSAGAGSRKIEYGAETVLDLGIEKDALEDANGLKPVTVKIEKNRNGAAGKRIALQFHGALQKFTEER